ncbi:hypothetical protein SC1_00359 [Sphingopyxis sp. C-1]|nr:hypothetical protein SC1_00359 [Sphingopyxis sp. C-1]
MARPCEWQADKASHQSSSPRARPGVPLLSVAERDPGSSPG